MNSRHSAVAALALTIASGALAQAKPEDEIRYRQSVMTVIARAFGPMSAMAQDKIPYSKDVVARNAQILEVLAPLPWPSFGPGLDKGAPTKADTRVWSEAQKFKDAQDKMQQAVTKLGQSVKGGDEKAVKSALGDLGRSCKGCHDDFRLKEARN